MKIFIENLEKALEREAYKSIVDKYEKGLCTLEEALIELGERAELEDTVFRAVIKDPFTMLGTTNYDMLMKIRETSTATLNEYMDWYLNRRSA